MIKVVGIGEVISDKWYSSVLRCILEVELIVSKLFLYKDKIRDDFDEVFGLVIREMIEFMFEYRKIWKIKVKNLKCVYRFW